MDAAVVAAIDARLDLASAEQGFRIVLAVESGSRAWGFPSPDSDYDCRFVYIRPQADYLSLYPPRDVIETPLDPVLDVNGWDLQKALRLLLKGNAVFVEWLTSPLVYRGDADFRHACLALAGQIVDRQDIARHYLHLGRGMAERFLSEAEPPLKKAFYALRPALALRWLRRHPQAAVAPMHFPTLCEETDLSAVARGEIDMLPALKARSREMGRDRISEALRELLTQELDLAGIEASLDLRPVEQRRELANRFFIDALRS